MPLTESQLAADLTSAMKDRAMTRVYVLRGVLTAAKNLKVEKRGAALDEAELVQIVRREIRKREEAEEFAVKAGRDDVIAQSREERAILEVYVPAPMNAVELDRNPLAADRVVRDLNADPTLPYPGHTFDAATCCVSVDYLVRPLEVFDEVARVLRPGGRFVCTFSNRCFPTKAIRGWLASDDAAHVALVGEYFHRSEGWTGVHAAERLSARDGDPLYAVWAETPTAG